MWRKSLVRRKGGFSLLYIVHISLLQRSHSPSKATLSPFNPCTSPFLHVPGPLWHTPSLHQHVFSLHLVSAKSKSRICTRKFGNPQAPRLPIGHNHGHLRASPVCPSLQEHTRKHPLLGTYSRRSHVTMDSLHQVT